MATEFADPQVDRLALKDKARPVPSSQKDASVAGQPFSNLSFELTRAVGFEAAHFMPGAEVGHSYRRVHGHSFQLEASVSGQAMRGRDWVVDLAALGSALQAIADRLDHGLLNEIEGLEVPTLERICAFAAGELVGQFPGLTRVTVSRPSLRESCTLRLG